MSLCKECAKPFYAIRKGHDFCSVECKNSYFKRRNKERCRVYFAKYKKKNSSKIRLNNKLRRLKDKNNFSTFRDRKRFGLNKKLVIVRDNYSCISCGLTNKEHLLKYGENITVHHIDGNEVNQDLNNLETLCVVCHAKKDRLRIKLEKRLGELRKNE